MNTKKNVINSDTNQGTNNKGSNTNSTGTELTETLSDASVYYEMKLSNGLNVKVKLPKNEKSIRQNEFYIRNALHIIFRKIYNVDDGTAMIMSNINSEDEYNTLFCEEHGLLSKLTHAKDIYDKMTYKEIEFDILNTIPSLKIDGQYYRYSKFSEGKLPDVIEGKDINFKKIRLDQFDKGVVLNRMNEMKKLFNEIVETEKKKYKFDLRIEEDKNYNYFKAYIIADQEVDGALYQKGDSEVSPVFEVKLEEYEVQGKKKYTIDYRSEYFGYNGSDLWLLNNNALKDHIRKGLLKAIHYFTVNTVETI